MTSHYIVRMTDLESLPHAIDAVARIDAVLGQDSGRCTLRLVTDQPEALEAALDDADDVTGYEREATAPTTRSITDAQIDTLGREAALAGDTMQAAICARATGDPFDFYALTEDEHARVESMTQEAARAECARVIADAQQD